MHVEHVGAYVCVCVYHISGHSCVGLIPLAHHRIKFKQLWTSVTPEFSHDALLSEPCSGLTVLFPLQAVYRGGTSEGRLVVVVVASSFTVAVAPVCSQHGSSASSLFVQHFYCFEKQISHMRVLSIIPSA